MEEKLYLIDNEGKKREAVRFVCDYCGKEYLKRVYKKKYKHNYCSLQCAKVGQRDRVELECSYCGKKFERTKGKLRLAKHDVYFCSRSCKDYAQRLDGGCPEIHPPHYGNGGKKSAHVKEYKADHVVCEGCGDKRKFLLVTHHKDCDRSNNSVENLEVVCWNCHAIRHMRNVNGEWQYSSYSVTDRDKLSLIMGL